MAKTISYNSRRIAFEAGAGIFYIILIVISLFGSIGETPTSTNTITLWDVIVILIALVFFAHASIKLYILWVISRLSD